MDYKQKIIAELDKYDCIYVTIEDEESIKKIHNLYCNNVMFDPVTTIELRYVGLYHSTVTKNYEEMEKYYNKSIIKGDDIAMCNLGCHHQGITKNYNEMEKYYKMAIERGNISAMNNLAWYHKNITKNYDEMEKYYKMAIDGGNCVSMYNLAEFHQYTTQNYEEMEKFYCMGIKKGDIDAMDELSEYYMENGLEMKLLLLYIDNMNMVDRTKVMKQFNIISQNIKEEDEEIFLKLIFDFKFCENDTLYTLLKLLVNTVNAQTDIMDLHFTYTVNGLGFEDAKKDFFNRCLS